MSSRNAAGNWTNGLGEVARHRGMKTAVSVCVHSQNSKRSGTFSQCNSQRSELVWSNFLAEKTNLAAAFSTAQWCKQDHGRSQEFDFLGGVYVLTSHCNFKTYVNVPHVNIYHIESVLGHRRTTTHCLKVDWFWGFIAVAYIPIYPPPTVARPLNKTKFLRPRPLLTRPRPRPPEVNKGTCRI